VTHRTLVSFGISGGARLQSMHAHAADSVHVSWTDSGMCVRFTVDQVHDRVLRRLNFWYGWLMYSDGISGPIFLKIKKNGCILHRHDVTVMSSS
jgi:hypothetical protein